MGEQEAMVLPTARRGDSFFEGTVVYTRQEAFILPSFKHRHRLYRLYREGADSFSRGIQMSSADISEWQAWGDPAGAREVGLDDIHWGHPAWLILQLCEMLSEGLRHSSSPKRDTVWAGEAAGDPKSTALLLWRPWGSLACVLQ